MTKAWKYIYGILALATSLLVLAIFSLPDSKLHLIACDVGQGDAILAVYKNTQILVDGGPDRKVLDCLGKYVPFWDREIEVVILTHPQDDHYGGLIDVFKSYQVDYFLANAVDSSTQGYQVLKDLVGGSDVGVVNPTTGTSIRLGLLHLDIVWPSEAKILEENASEKKKTLGAFTTKDDLNTFSIVANLSLGDFDALLTGDIRQDTIEAILMTGGIHDVEYIKVPHHGSKNGLTKELVDATTPEVVVISVGKNNRYGHPNQETLDLLKTANVKILRTDEIGDIEIISDGKFWRLR